MVVAGFLLVELLDLQLELVDHDEQTIFPVDVLNFATLNQALTILDIVLQVLDHLFNRFFSLVRRGWHLFRY